MKKVLIILLNIMLLFCVCGCDKQDNNDNKKPTINKAEDEEEEIMYSEDDEFILDDITPTEGKLKVAFIGDSITYGYLTEDHEKQAYPAQLLEMMSYKYIFGNFGKNAAYCIDAESEYNVKSDSKDRYYRNTEEYKKSLEFEPDVVIIMLGTNDIRSIAASENAIDVFKDALLSIVNEYKALPTVKKVYVASSKSSPLHSSSVIRIYSDGILQEYQKEVAEMAEVDYIDIYSLTKDILTDSKYFCDDNLHLTALGQQVIAKAFYSYFKK